MSKIKQFLNKAKEKLFIVLKRYPVAIVLLLAAAIMFMIAIDISANERVFVRLAMSLIYGGVLSLIIKSVVERYELSKTLEWLLYIIVYIAVVLVFFFLIPDLDSTQALAKYFILLVLTASLFFFVPFIKTERSASYFAQKVFLRLAITMIYYGIIVGGVEAIIFAIENLLSVAMPNDIYSQTAVLIAGLFIPSFFFAGIPTGKDAEESYPKLVKILLHFIVYILLSAYSVVLYAYFIKILFELELPSNLLGNLVIYYSIISIAALYFGHYTKDESKWTRTFNRVFPYILIIPTLMMLLSFIVRISQYGFTEPRYYSILCVIFVLGSIGIIKIQKKVKLIPVVISVLLLISIFGPLSSFNVSNRSQNRRFENILTKANMLDGEKIIPNADANEDTRHEISQIVDYFSTRSIISELKYVDSDFTYDNMKDQFGFEWHYKSREVNSYFINTQYEKYQIIDVKDYDYFVNLSSYSEDLNLESDESNIIIRTTDEDTDENLYLMSIIVDEKEIYSKDMLSLMLPLLKSANNNKESSQEHIITEETDLISIKIIILNAHYEEDEYFYYDVKLLFSLK